MSNEPNVTSKIHSSNTENLLKNLNLINEIQRLDDEILQFKKHIKKADNNLDLENNDILEKKNIPNKILVAYYNFWGTISNQND